MCRDFRDGSIVALEHTKPHFRAPTCFGGARKGVPKVDCLGVQGLQGWQHCGFGTHKENTSEPLLVLAGLGKVCQRWIAWVCRDCRDGSIVALGHTKKTLQSPHLFWRG